MKNCNVAKYQATRRILPMACAGALAVAFTAPLVQTAVAAQITPPPVPDNIQVLAPNHVFFVGHGVGTQNYVCAPSTAATAVNGVAFKLFTPEATLFNDDGDKALTTHYFSPNPDELNTDTKVVADGVIRATWQDTGDSSRVWASGAPKDGGDSSTDARFVAQNAIAWVKLKVTGVEDGPDGGDRLTKTTFIQRLNTQGGLAPSEACDSPSELGNSAFVPYTADYFFYTDQ